MGFIRSIAAAGLALYCGASASANGGERIFYKEFAGCTTKAHLVEFVNAAGRKDYKTMNYKLRTQCVNLKGQRYTVLQTTLSKAKIRLWIGDNPLDLWTVREAVRG